MGRGKRNSTCRLSHDNPVGDCCIHRQVVGAAVDEVLTCFCTGHLSSARCLNNLTNSHSSQERGQRAIVVALS